MSLNVNFDVASAPKLSIVTGSGLVYPGSVNQTIVGSMQGSLYDIVKTYSDIVVAKPASQGDPASSVTVIS